MSFVVVGAGPDRRRDGRPDRRAVEPHPAQSDFRHIDPTMAQITLVDAAPQVLPAFGDRLGEIAQRRLAKMGVDVQLGAKVVDVDATGIEVQDVNDPSGYVRRIEARRQGVGRGRAGQPARPVGRQAGRRRDRPRRSRQGATPTSPCPATPRCSSLGDMIALDNLPGVAQVAIQGGKFAAKQVKRRLDGQPTAAGVPLLRQGLHGDHLAVLRGGQRGPAPVRRVRRVDALAGDPPLLPHRVQVTGSPRCCTGSSRSSAAAGRSGPSPSSRSSPARRSSASARRTSPTCPSRPGLPPASNRGSAQFRARRRHETRHNLRSGSRQRRGRRGRVGSARG